MTTQPEPAPASAPDTAWLTPGVRGIGGASLLADIGHEIPTALLPSLLTSTLRAPASARAHRRPLRRSRRRRTHPSGVFHRINLNSTTGIL
jgi:hypothetical protein